MEFSNWWENRRFVSAGPMGGTCLLDLVWETLNENASRQARVPDYIYIKGTGEPFFHYKNQQKMRRLKSTARLYIYIYIYIYTDISACVGGSFLQCLCAMSVASVSMPCLADYHISPPGRAADVELFGNIWASGALGHLPTPHFSNPKPPLDKEKKCNFGENILLSNYSGTSGAFANLDDAVLYGAIWCHLWPSGSIWRHPIRAVGPSGAI